MTTIDAIKGLKGIAEWNFGKYEQTGEEDYRNDGEFLENVAELLKSQEPVVPVFSPEIEMDMSHWDCGACGGFLMGNAYPNAIKYIKPQYCSHCGRAVKWE